ncbi:MAG TPA: sugar ABC transporter permease [Segeticoccus sp.]|uniref:carbohydrate ABC transporter permease n=1 Tax=Segeticoccus sp. TaxID=2706531 RepID=UPI002D80FD5C|nr:sugar ABC transporter permease [Segeticoccus sp.]HET8601021.1 sugar ABC transporter permease [Segeticoccus sp.]
MTNPAVPAGEGASPSPARKSHKPGGRTLTFDKVSFFVVCLGVPLAVFLLFVIWPFVQAFYYSLTNWSGFSTSMQFIGLDNYVTLFTDDTFLKALRNNVLLALVVPFVTLTLALALATMLTVGGRSTGAVQGLRRSGLYRVISFFPYAIPAIVIGLIWNQVYDPSAGLLNGILTKLGISSAHGFPWLGDSRTAIWSVMFVIIWSMVGFYTILFVAAIKGIPAELYDAARIDGAGRLRTAFSVTIPLIRENVQTAYIYLGILVLDAFVYMQALEPGGGPQNSTLTMSQDLYVTAFQQSKFGLASAMGVVLALVTLTFAAVVFSVNRLAGGRTRAKA